MEVPIRCEILLMEIGFQLLQHRPGIGKLLMILVAFVSTTTVAPSGYAKQQARLPGRTPATQTITVIREFGKK